MPIHVKKMGKMYPTSDPALHSADWMAYAVPFCSSFTMSPTIILKGCMAMLMDVSRNMRLKSPNHMAALSPRKSDWVKVKLPALGRRSITATAMSAPTNR